jgi:hypothetical protein
MATQSSKPCISGDEYMRKAVDFRNNMCCDPAFKTWLRQGRAWEMWGPNGPPSQEPTWQERLQFFSGPGRGGVTLTIPWGEGTSGHCNTILCGWIRELIMALSCWRKCSLFLGFLCSHTCFCAHTHMHTHSHTQTHTYSCSTFHHRSTPFILPPHSHFFFLFICAYNAWVISPSFPHPLPYHPSNLSLSPNPLDTLQKLFCPYF